MFVCDSKFFTLKAPVTVLMPSVANQWIVNMLQSELKNLFVTLYDYYHLECILKASRIENMLVYEKK